MWDSAESVATVSLIINMISALFVLIQKMLGMTSAMYARKKAGKEGKRMLNTA